jgi:predicted DNA-binding transcriptional regulator YafY
MKKLKQRMDRMIRFIAELKRNSFPNAESFAKKLLNDEMNGSRVASVSVKTIKRDIGFLKNEMGAPLNYDPINKGYYLSEDWIFPFWELGNKELFASLMSGKIGETALPSCSKTLNLRWIRNFAIHRIRSAECGNSERAFLQTSGHNPAGQVGG